MDEQNSAYRPTSFARPRGREPPDNVTDPFLPAIGSRGKFSFSIRLPCRNMATHTQYPAEPQPYPKTWRQVAELRVLKAKPGEWDKLSQWRRDMTGRGWTLLKITTTPDELTAIFGKTVPSDSD